MPKTVQIDQHSTLSPAELEVALKAETRFSLVPFQGSPLGGRAQLRGRVRKGRVNVGLAHRDWWTLLQPTFRGRIEPSSTGGSRLVGELGVPRWLVWELRLAFGVVVPLGILAAGWPMLQEWGSTGLLATGAFALVAVLMTIFGIGLQLSHADQLLDRTAGVLDGIAGGAPVGTATGTAQSRATPSRDAAKAAARARAGQEVG